MSLCSHTSCRGERCRQSPLHPDYDMPRCAQCGETERSLIHSLQPVMEELDGSEMCHPFVSAEASGV